MPYYTIATLSRNNAVVKVGETKYVILERARAVAAGHTVERAARIVSEGDV